jgi:hypothetical protein
MRFDSIKIFVASVSIILAAPQSATTVVDKPMLWESTTQIVSDTLHDKNYKHWTNTTGPPETSQLCVLPYRPKVGKVPTLGNCSYSKVINRNGRILRKRICTNEFGIKWETKITGLETSNHYEFRLASKMKSKNGELIKETIMIETGRLIGDCPLGTEPISAFAQ